MYRLTNQSQNTEKTYKNKDLVFQAIERENARVKHLHAEGLLLLEEMDKKGVVINQSEIYLPFEGIADSLFLKVTDTVKGVRNSELRQLSLKPSENKNDQVSDFKKEEPHREPISDTPKPAHSKILTILRKGGLILSLLISLGLSGVATTLFLQQNKEVDNLAQQVKQLESLQLERGKLDVFARYFLPYYYSEQGDLSPFVSPALNFNNQTGQLQSVILESVSQMNDKTYQLTYVLAVKEGEARNQKRLNIVVTVSLTSQYGYQVLQEPVVTDYPK